MLNVNTFCFVKIIKRIFKQKWYENNQQKGKNWNNAIELMIFWVDINQVKKREILILCNFTKKYNLINSFIIYLFNQLFDNFD